MECTCAKLMEDKDQGNTHREVSRKIEHGTGSGSKVKKTQVKKSSDGNKNN
jgi:hypothetical protein